MTDAFQRLPGWVRAALVLARDPTPAQRVTAGAALGLPRAPPRSVAAGAAPAAEVAEAAWADAEALAEVPAPAAGMAPFPALQLAVARARRRDDDGSALEAFAAALAAGLPRENAGPRGWAR